jgi:catechol 2,3-dioxygenase-like lactoylglutathione lyase family enzyme
MAETAARAAVTFHLSLNTANLKRAVEFGRVLFGREPAKLHDDYAKFEIADPAVILSLVPQTPASGTPRGQFGITVDDPATLAELRARLERAEVVFHPRRNEAGEPASIDIADPDGNNWRFALAESADAPMPLSTVPLTMADADEPVLWEHCVTHPLPARIPFDGNAAEIRLTGSFNAASLADRCGWLASEAFRALKPGGKIVLHGLMADREITGPPPTLPGLAAMVSRVPSLAEPLAILKKAGFVDLHFVKLTETPWFMHQGIGLREVKLVGRKPERPGRATRIVMYKGPFAEFVDDQGQTYVRGERVAVSPARSDALRQGSAGENFAFIAPEVPRGCCGL